MAQRLGSGPPLRVTLGPILFHWPAERKIDFYARIADEAPIDTVYIGEVVCAKRAPFFERHQAEVVERLRRGGKRVVYSSLGEVMLKRERDMIAEFCQIEDAEIEINDGSALYHIKGRPHRVGPMMNVYNEETLTHLAERGAKHFALVPELPRPSVALLSRRAHELGVGIELQVFGRTSLAISARCYHARAHGRVKDNCQFVCEQDPDGMPLKTLDGRDILAINGIQTLSHGYLCLLDELADIAALGVTDIRLSPHSVDMVATARIFRGTAEGRMDPAEAERQLMKLALAAPLANGFWHGKAGHLRIGAGESRAP